MNTEEIKMIGEIDFRDIKVKVYYHPDNKDKLNSGGCVWQMRNPDSCYQGIMYMDNETGKCSYPECVIIPEQTDKDREILPKFIIVGNQDLDDGLVKSISIYLESEYFRKNKTNF
jgi:hypothetical protein